MTLQNYEWTVDGRPDGKLRKAGDPAKMTEAEAKYHLQMGHLKPARSAVKAPSNASEKAPRPTASDPAGEAVKTSPVQAKPAPKK